MCGLLFGLMDVEDRLLNVNLPTREQCVQHVYHLIAWCTCTLLHFFTFMYLLAFLCPYLQLKGEEYASVLIGALTGGVVGAASAILGRTWEEGLSERTHLNFST